MQPNYSTTANNDKASQTNIMNAVGYGDGLGGAATYVATPAPDPTTDGSVQGAATYQAPDPYAQYGGKAAYDSKVNAFNIQDQGALNTAGTSGDEAARNYNSSILDYLSGARQQQNTINSSGVQSELAKRQGNQSVLDYVHNGIQSGGVMLGNKNAQTSSATEALARAYSSLGQHQLAGVGTQYAQDQNKINTQQDNLGIANANQARHNEDYKANSVAGIVAAANQAISNIRANMAYASLPDSIDQQSQIAQIQAQTQAKLAAFDPAFANGVAGITPSSLTDRQGAAQNLQLQGTAAANPYQLTTEAPAAFRNGGQPAGSDLPIFTLNKKQTA